MLFLYGSCECLQEETKWTSDGMRKSTKERRDVVSAGKFGRHSISGFGKSWYEEDVFNIYAYFILFIHTYNKIRLKIQETILFKVNPTNYWI